MQANPRRWLRERLVKIFKHTSRMDNRLKNEALIKAGLLHIGRHTYGDPIIHSYKGSEASVKIGAFCSISPGVVFITGGIHPVDWVSLFPFRARFNLDEKFRDGMPTTHGDIVVGNDVWIGTKAMIMSGVHIGDGAVIAARSVITKDVPAYTMSAGVPAKTIRKRFSDDEIESLLLIKWWEEDDSSILKLIDYLSSPNITEFLEMKRKSL